MADARIRIQIALLAVRLMYERSESEYFTANRKAASRLGPGHRHRPGDLPSSAEVRERIRVLADLHEGPERGKKLKSMRVAALRMMRLLSAFKPRLIGSVMTGHTREGSDIDLQVSCDQVSSVAAVLEDEWITCDVQRKRVRKHWEERTFTHLHLRHFGHEFELTLYDANKVNYVFKSSITGKAIERATVAELEGMLGREYPGQDFSDEALELGAGRGEGGEDVKRWEVFRRLLGALENRSAQRARRPPLGRSRSTRGASSARPAPAPASAKAKVTSRVKATATASSCDPAASSPAERARRRMRRAPRTTRRSFSLGTSGEAAGFDILRSGHDRLDQRAHVVARRHEARAQRIERRLIGLHRLPRDQPLVELAGGARRE